MSDRSPRLSAVVAMTADRVIGKDGELPWHIPEDLKVFKRITLGHPIVMGRKTFDSIGRPLPKRQNVVLTRDRNWSLEGVNVIHSKEELNELVFEESKSPTVYIIGGSEIYKAFLPELDELYVSKVKHSYSGDTYFPSFEEHFRKKELIEDFDEFSLIRYTR